MTTPTPPIAARIPLERSHHGDVFVDHYEWMRDKESPEVVAHLEAENAYTDALTAGQEQLRTTLFEEIKGRVKETDMEVPVREGEWWFYSRSVEGQQYGIHCRAPIVDPADWNPPALPEDGSGLPGEQILLDDNVEAEGLEFYSLGSFDVSTDGTLMLWAVDTEGDERYTLRVRRLDPISGSADSEVLGDEVAGTSGGAFFDLSGEYIFYTTVDESWRPDTVWRHRIGTPAGDDVAVFTEPDERYWVGAGLTRSRRYLVIEVGSKITSETRMLEASDPTGSFEVVWPRVEGVEYSVEHAIIGGEDRFLITHNVDALDFELVSVAASDPTGERVVLMPHREGVRIEDVDAFAGQLTIEYRREALPRIAVATLDGVGATDSIDWHEIPFGEELYSAGVGGNPEWEQPTVRMGYTSFTFPSMVFDYDVATGERRILKQQEVQGGYDAGEYEARREWAKADDGTLVPLSLVYRRDTVLENAPTLLYGYGSYEHSIDPGFSVARISLLDRGVVFAIAHVRGGGEMGRHWYEDGKTLTKKNTFRDFVACAQHLIDTGVTTASRLVAEGGSAGGLLMGAVANLAPSSFAGILAAVPFVDPLTSILDPELPLTVIEWDEWGNPLADASVYEYMKSYSPYENVREGVAYPQILAVTSINDTRVLYVEPAKWVARLREVGAPVLLRTEMSAGHGGVSGRYAAWEKRALELAWMLGVLGLADSA